MSSEAADENASSTTPPSSRVGNILSILSANYIPHLLAFPFLDDPRHCPAKDTAIMNMMDLT